MCTGESISCKSRLNTKEANYWKCFKHNDRDACIIACSRLPAVVRSAFSETAGGVLDYASA